MPFVKMSSEDARDVFPVGVNLEGGGVRERVKGEGRWGPVQHALGEAGYAPCKAKA